MLFLTSDDCSLMDSSCIGVTISGEWKMEVQAGPRGIARNEAIEDVKRDRQRNNCEASNSPSREQCSLGIDLVLLPAQFLRYTAQ